jgi:ABC-type transporter Mla subunit MlaD
MNRQAIVGLFTILGLAGLFAIFIVLANIGTGGRYLTAVHFKTAAGLHRGALVYESGVNVGVVQETRLLPEDFTVDVIMAINNNVDIPRDSRFLITAPLTGDTTLEILPPLPAPRPVGVVGPTPIPHDVALLPREVLPLEQQPQGTNPTTLSDLLEEGQGEVHRLDGMLSQLETAEPKLLATLQSTLTNANALTEGGTQRLYALSDRVDALLATLQGAANQGSKNIVDLTQVLDQTTRANAGKIDNLLTNLNQTSIALNQTIDAARDLATNPQVHQNLLDTTKGLATTATTIGEITTDLRTITGNPQTQAQLRDTVANVDAATQKLNVLLRELGATSSVYGVDPGATPAPVPSGHTAPAPGGAPATVSGAAVATFPPLMVTASPIPVPVPVNAATTTPTTAQRQQTIQSRLAGVVADLFALQIRISELNAQKSGTLSSQYLTSDKGPQTDFNLIVLPHSKLSLMGGANDIGTPQTTANVVLSDEFGKNLRIGGGMLYSNLGGLLQYNPGILGVEARLYDLRYPTLDMYGNVNVSHSVKLFGGERDILHNGRRTVFGLQLQF